MKRVRGAVAASVAVVLAAACLLGITPAGAANGPWATTSFQYGQEVGAAALDPQTGQSLHAISIYDAIGLYATSGGKRVWSLRFPASKSVSTMWGNVESVVVDAPNRVAYVVGTSMRFTGTTTPTTWSVTAVDLTRHSASWRYESPAQPSVWAALVPAAVLRPGGGVVVVWTPWNGQGKPNGEATYTAAATALSASGSVDWSWQQRTLPGVATSAAFAPNGLSLVITGERDNADGGWAVALLASNGTPLWSRTTSMPLEYSAPAADGGADLDTVYVAAGSPNGHDVQVTAIRMLTNETLWSASVGAGSHRQSRTLIGGLTVTSNGPCVGGAHSVWDFQPTTSRHYVPDTGFVTCLNNAGAVAWTDSSLPAAVAVLASDRSNILAGGLSVLARTSPLRMRSQLAFAQLRITDGHVVTTATAQYTTVVYKLPRNVTILSGDGRDHFLYNVPELGALWKLNDTSVTAS